MTDSNFISDVEKEVCCRMANGERHKEIAAALQFHENMVDYHLRKLRARFGCSTNIHLISTLQAAGLLS